MQEHSKIAVAIEKCHEWRKIRKKLIQDPIKIGHWSWFRGYYVPGSLVIRKALLSVN
jgi:hypothetical protein